MNKTEKNDADRTKSFREIRYEEKRQAIIKSAAKAFGQKGFHAATIEDITNELKMTKGSLYYYFSTKEELLYKAHVLSLSRVLESILKINASGAPPAERIRAAITRHLQVLAEDFEGAFMLQYEFHLPPDYRDEILAMRNRYEENFVRIIRDGMESGEFRVANPRMVAFVMLGAINWFLRWYSSTGKHTVEEIADVYIDLFCLGLLNQHPADPADE